MRIIAFEGIDGSGKTVQMHYLERALVARGLVVKTLSFPVYDGFFGKHIGDYLTCAHGVSAADVDSKSMALWFALDRFEALRELDFSGVDVLLINRYVLSNAVYQSIRERDLLQPDILDFVLTLEHTYFKLPVPDLYIYLDVYIEDAGKNVLKKGYRDYAGNEKDVYEAQTDMQLRARAKYIEYAKRLDTIAIVQCMEKSRLCAEAEIARRVENVILQRDLLS